MNPCPKAGQVRLNPYQYRKLKARLLERDGYRCRNPLCNCTDVDILEMEHKRNRSLGRMDTDENCVILCYWCNRKKKGGNFRIEWDGNIALEVWERKGPLHEWERRY